MKITEKNFVRNLEDRNEKALEYVIDNYGALVKAIVKKYISKLDNIQEECINDIFLAVWYGIDKYDSERSSFKNWIAGISKFKAIDYQRKYNNLLNENNIDNLDLGSQHSIEDTMLENSRKELANEILNGLSKDERIIFQEFYIKEKKATEIGQNLGIRESVVYNKLSRTRKKLRHKYRNRILEVIENE